MAAANNEFFEALSMLEHERGITAEYLIEKIKAAIVIAVKKNYEVEDDNVLVEIDPDSGKFNVALVQNVVADEDWYDEHAEIGITEAQKIRKSYEVGDRVVTPLKTKDFGRIAAQTAKHVIRQGIREAEHCHGEGEGADPRDELAALGGLAGVHQGTDDGVIHGVPDLGDQQQDTHVEGVDLQDQGVEDRQIHGAVLLREAAAQIAQCIADLVLHGEGPNGLFLVHCVLSSLKNR